MLKHQYSDHSESADSEKILMLGTIKGKRRRGWQENEMAGRHHQLKGHESEQTLGDGEGQGSLGCFSPGVTKSQA